MSKSKYKSTIYAIRDDSNNDSANSDGSADKQLWCICRSNDSSRFMIACDACEEWYHGDCINITPKMAESIKKYFCTWCQKKNQSLKIVYKHGISIINKSKEKSEKKSIEFRFDKQDRFVRPKIEEKLAAPFLKSQKSIKFFNCGECMGCLRKVDCNFCQNCRLKSGSGCLRRMCQKKTQNQSIIVEKIPVKPQEKVMLTKLPMDFIPLKSATTKKMTVFNKLPQQQKPAILSSSSSPSSSSSKCSEPPLPPPVRDHHRGGREGGTQKSPSIISESGKSQISIYDHLLPSSKLVEKHSEKFHHRAHSHNDSREMSEDSDDGDEAESDENDKTEETEEEDEEESMSDGGKKSALKYAQSRLVKKPKNKYNFNHSLAKKRKMENLRRLSRKKSRKTEPEPIKNYKSFDCYNIGCHKPSRMGSKYCSDECGISLAKQRLLKYLPERISNWKNSVSVSEEKDKLAQLKIKEEIKTIHYNLDILNTSHDDLTDFIDRWRSTCSASITSSVDCSSSDESVQCVTCGSMVGSLKALAHMENCFQKIEGATMVFGDFEEQPLGTKLFCDYYDCNISGYCKRLAALCDHTKDTKIDSKTICAFPLSVNEKSDKVCMTAKLKCNQHINWERIQRAVIDINRYRLLVRFEDLLAEDRRLKQSMCQRGGALALLTHETIDHQPLKSISPLQVTKQQEKKMIKFTKAICI